ncbi:MAG: hypothetical protein DMG57_42130 [Acidobacteria bacterium]|nr:MAG: hypothetical protein DMG57_42130 [Acidobacteriota bacterium]
MLATLLACGLRRAERVALRMQDLQIREDHWVIADLMRKRRFATMLKCNTPGSTGSDA